MKHFTIVFVYPSIPGFQTEDVQTHCYSNMENFICALEFAVRMRRLYDDDICRTIDRRFHSFRVIL